MNENKADANQPVWNRLDALSDGDLAAVVESTIFVLKQGVEGGDPSPTEMPPGPMVQALEQLLAERGLDTGAAGRIVKQPTLSRPVAIALLQEIGREPTLAQEIENVWRERRGMLVVEPASILAAALLLLVLKVKKVKVSKKEGVTVDFTKISTGALGKVFEFAGGP